MTNGSDRPSGPDEPGTPDADRPADDEPSDDRSPGSRLGTEKQADPLEELRRRQYTERQAREREDERRRREEDERRRREHAEREARERRERDRRREEQRQRERSEREAREAREARERRERERRQREERDGRDAATPAEPSRPTDESGAPTGPARAGESRPPGVTEPPATPPSRPGPEALRRPRPSLPGDPRGPRRPEPEERGSGGDETRPLPSVESGAPRERPPDPSRQRPSDVPQMRKPWERPAPAAFSSPGSRVDERAPTRPEPPETRPMPAPGPPRPPRPEEPAKEPTAEDTAAVAGSQEAAIPRLQRPPRQGPVRRRVTGVDARSIFKLALAFYLGIFVTVVAGGTALWFVLTAIGVIGNFESFLGELLGYEDFEFIFSRIIVVVVLAGLVWVVLSAAVTALFAAIYNRASRFTGGLGVTVDDDA